MTLEEHMDNGNYGYIIWHVIKRLELLNKKPDTSSREYSIAITKLEEAVLWLDQKKKVDHSLSIMPMDILLKLAERGMEIKEDTK